MKLKNLEELTGDLLLLFKISSRFDFKNGKVIENFNQKFDFIDQEKPKLWEESKSEDG